MEGWMRKHKLIDTALDNLSTTLGPPPPPVDVRMFVGDILDGKFPFLCEQIGDVIFGHNKIHCACEYVVSSEHYHSGVWCSEYTKKPRRDVVPKTTIAMRPFYVLMMPKEQIIFDIALELSILRQRYLYAVKHSEEKRLAHLLCMYCGFAEVCVEETLYVNLKMTCGRRSLKFTGNEMPLSPAEASYTLRAIQEMRVT